MNKAPPFTVADIVTLDGNQLPQQVWRTDDVKLGPAYHSEAEALSGENTKRHTAQIFLYDQDGKELLTWWEVSQPGLRERLGHAEQKALLRMRLRQGLFVLMQGTYPCCPYGTGCMNALSDLAELHNCVFVYRAARNNAVYHFERIGRWSAVKERDAVQR